jgi:hypothetical protein
MALRTASFISIMVAASAAAAGLNGCFSSTDGDSTTGCLDNRQYFEREIWGRFMQANCAKCHTPGGIAVDQGSKLLLQNAAYPGFVDQNLATLTEISKISYEGRSELLQKPLGKMNHGGGKVLDEGSDDYNRLATLVARLGQSSDPSCGVQVSPLANVQTLTPLATLRKASIDLAGRLPNQQEIEAVRAGGEAALDGALDGLMKEDVFFERVREMYNDLMLTDRGMQYSGAAINFTNPELYPGLAIFNDPNYYSDPRRPLVNRAIAREPLDLIAYVVRKERPFTEVLTAPYAVVNPYSALAYGVDVSSFADPTNYNDWKEVQVTYQGKTPGPVPHAGVLSTPAFVNRWQTTPTNRSRARARRVYQFFLATDVLKIADRPVDASKLTAIQNPTMNSEFCNVCHKTLDPLAGAFRGWDENDYERFSTQDQWHSDMEAPGFGGEKMDPTYYTKALQWAAPKVASDPRFSLGAAYVAYQGLTGRKPISYPTDSASPDYASKIQGWEVQDAFFRDVAAKFTASKFNFKSLVKLIVLSPYYRGTGYNGALPANAAAALADLGIGELLSPEALNRKIVAVTGAHWRKDYDYASQHDYLVEDYPILFGGIDSDSVVERTRVPNSIMASVVSRMANEQSCRLTAFDFTRPQAERRFFKNVKLDQVPMSAGAEVPGSIAAIKENIRYLHELLLGEDLSVTDPEIERTYQVFLGTWKELSGAAKPETGLDYGCWGRSDPQTGVALPDASAIHDDKNFTVRAWGAVFTYLLSDWKFTHH